MILNNRANYQSDNLMLHIKKTVRTVLFASNPKSKGRGKLPLLSYKINEQLYQKIYSIKY